MAGAPPAAPLGTPSSPVPETPAKRENARWTSADDAVLVDTLEQKKAEGQQADNGWKPGVWVAVAAALVGGPGGVKTAKGCQDHWRTQLVKDYNTVTWLRYKLSGFGWDEDRKIVTADDDVWEALLKKHKGVGKWQTRSFPLYDRIAALVDGKQAKGDRTVRVGEVTTSASTTGSTSTTSTASSAGSQETSSTVLPVTPRHDRQSPQTSGSHVAARASAHGRVRSLSASSGVSRGRSRSRRSRSSSISSGASRSRSRSRSRSHSRGRRHNRSARRPSKRKAASESRSPSPISSKKRGRITGPVAVNNVAGAMSQVASTFGAAATEIATPTRRSRAVMAVSQDKSLSSEQRIQALCLFTKDIAVCDSYLAIPDKTTRTAYLAAILESS